MDKRIKQSLIPLAQNKKNTQRPSETRNTLLRFTDLAFRMGAIIILGTLAGRWLDSKMGFDKPIFTLILSLLAIGGSIYMVYRDVSKPN
jgi:F0F1-type ATP synthase assembly protein I